MNPSAHADLDEALDHLPQASSVYERLDILKMLVEYWHGPVGPDDGLSGEELEGVTLPFPLRWWYRFAGRRTGLVDGQNQLLPTNWLNALDEGRLHFYSENQGVYIWATAPAGEDPPVWGKFNEDELPWTDEGVRLSEFLIQACVIEGIWNAPYGANCAWARQSTLGQIVAPLNLLPLAPWHWPEYPSRFYYGRGIFTFSCPKGSTKASRAIPFGSAQRHQSH